MASSNSKAEVTSEVPAVALSDLVTIFGLPFLLATSWLLPERRWCRLCQAVVPFAAPMMVSEAKKLHQAIGTTFGEREPVPSPEAILRDLTSEHVLSQLQLLRCYRPGGWRPERRFVGRPGGTRRFSG